MSSQGTVETMVTAEGDIERRGGSAATEPEEKDTLQDVKEELTAPSTPPSSGQEVEKGEAAKKEEGSKIEESRPSTAGSAVPVEHGSAPTADDISQSEYKDIAKQMFKESFVSIQPEEYTQFLAANDEESTRIRGYYMDLFDWDPNLLKSTRKLCSKLYLKGESQEIDRILSSFTKSYVKQHPNNIFCTRNFEKIYIVIYSLILLNTALHNSELNKKSKISQTEYIRNTFTTFIQQDPKNPKKLSIKQRIIIERELSHYYDDIAKCELHLKQADDEKSGKNSKTASSSDSSPSQQSKRATHPSTFITGSSGIAHLSRTNSHTNESEYTALSRQVSNSSIWSTDTMSNRRSSLAMQRMNSATSGVSHFTNAATARVGFTRALLSDSNQKLYRNNNSSHNSNISSATTIRNRQSYDQMRVSSNQTTRSSNALTKRSSRASVISRDSTHDFGDDTMSVLSFDSTNLNNLEFREENLPQQQLEDFDVNDYQDRFDLTLELQGSPYLKEGLLKLKILNNDQQDNNMTTELSSSSSVVSTSSTTSGASRFFSFFRSSSNNKPSNNAATNAATSLLPNKFIENFVVVSKGELSLYSFDPKIIKKHQQKMNKLKQKKLVTLTDLDEEDDENVGDGNWLKNAANIGNYNLCSSIAQLEKQSSGSSQSKKSVLWSLTFPKVSKRPAKKFIFEAGTKEIALEFINTCNFWAAKITAIPTLEESVSSIEYGWTNLDYLIRNKDQFKKKKNIYKWEPLAKGVYLSNYIVANDADHSGMMKQFVKTLKYYTHLKKLYQDFSKMKVKFAKSLPSKQYASSNYARVISNYDAKIAEYKSELQKYKNYVIILGFGLQLRFDLEEEDAAQEFEANETTDNASTNNDPSQGKKDDEELTKLVKLEIGNLFVNMKGIGEIIPTFQSSKSLTNMKDLMRQQKNVSSDDGSMNASFTLVKSPKTYTLSNFKETESPITQLLQSTNNDHESHNEFSHSFSTNTIKEEDEPEEQEIARSSHIRAGSNGTKLLSVAEVQATNAVGQSA